MTDSAVTQIVAGATAMFVAYLNFQLGKLRHAQQVTATVATADRGRSRDAIERISDKTDKIHDAVNGRNAAAMAAAQVASARATAEAVAAARADIDRAVAKREQVATAAALALATAARTDADRSNATVADLLAQVHALQQRCGSPDCPLAPPPPPPPPPDPPAGEAPA